MPLEGEGGYSLELVQHRPDGPGGREAGSQVYTTRAVSSVKKIFGDAFAPLILSDGSDMLDLICRSCVRSGGGDMDFDYSGA